MGFKALLQLANALGPDATLYAEIHKNSVGIKAPNSVNAQPQFLYFFFFFFFFWSRRGPGHIFSKTSGCIFKLLRFEKSME